jgi:hypothetical protein
MLTVFTVIIMFAVGYAQHRNGLFSSIAMVIQIILAGLFAFNFFEPLADALDPTVQGSFLAGTEDLLALIGLFCLALGLLRYATNTIAPLMIDYHGYVQLIGAGIVGMFAGYLASGFLVCALETLPIDERFLGYEPRSAQESPMRSLMPPDRVWLALMRHAGAYPLRSVEDAPDQDHPYDRFRTFDRFGSYELRYLRHRRYSDQRGPIFYGGEFDKKR